MPFCLKRLRTLKLFQIFRTKIKKSKTQSGLCLFQCLSNGTTLMQIQSGRTVPLKVFFYPAENFNLIKWSVSGTLFFKTVLFSIHDFCL
jgi:hypothetical protein